MDYGSLRGVKRAFLNHKHQWRLVVWVAILQRSVAAEVDSDWVPPLKTEPRPVRTGASRWRAIGNMH
jgi:hypothetical protein